MLFTDAFVPFSLQAGRVGFLPAADVTVSDGDMVLTLDLPGLTAQDLEIEVLDDDLMVRGERRRPEVAEGTRWVHSERPVGRFERRIKLPRGVDPDKVTASMTDGVLSLIVPKPERLIPKAIKVAAGEQQRELETATA